MRNRQPTSSYNKATQIGPKLVVKFIANGVINAPSHFGRWLRRQAPMEIINKFIFFVLIFCGAVAAEEQGMSKQDAQKTWGEYHERIKNRRLTQARLINLELDKNNITSEIDLILDFSFFTQNEAGANGLKNQLSENYEMTISKKGEYWHINGTSRPYAVNLTTEQHLG
ncbi:hypothetical protein [Ferrimonas sp. SCSIO 43195]|uniref:hypothetical protein n=1 Tax=Ferrimonas sp. SCSIO 43195 TaxID=2822844 RepID=UPI00207597E9|nr:hypothetical protein [Ferrimonas sp. SCSIO 43195]USD36893.1 hypothetical protein J8Z22_18135 [Ferrimonas sp. SCSIO 43195]